MPRTRKEELLDELLKENFLNFPQHRKIEDFSVNSLTFMGQWGIMLTER